MPVLHLVSQEASDKGRSYAKCCCQAKSVSLSQFPAVIARRDYDLNPTSGRYVFIE